MKRIKINNPCFESWDEMESISGGSFCEKCSKKVWDFTDKEDLQIQKIIKSNKNICGRIISDCNKFTKTTASIILITGTTIFNNINAQRGIETGAVFIESTKNNKAAFSGTLLFEEDGKPIVNAEIMFICLKKHIQVKTDKNGNFSFKVPDDLLAKENLVYFNFENKTSKPDIPENRFIPSKFRYGNRYLYFAKEEFKTERVYRFPEGKIAKMGSVAIDPEPTFDYYYFNGKKITKEHFVKISTKNPNYKKIVLTDYPAKVVLNKEDIEHLYLLYSN